MAKDAPVELMRAAKELQAYVEKTSGAQLRITVGDVPGKERVEIRLGVVTPSIPGLASDPSKTIVHADGYRLESGGRRISITGGSPRGTLYGVYDFIERVLGVRWFMPTPMGEDVVGHRTIPVPQLNLVRNPAFPEISGFTWAGSPGAEDWELRMRVRVGKPATFGHNWYNIFPQSKENVAQHPEMFAMVDGRRGGSPQLCSSNKDVVRVSVEAARRYFDANPDSPLFSISPNDGAGWCECEQCRKVDELYGVTDGTLADRFVHYANQVLVELRKTHPGKQVGIYAYAEHTAPPKRARPLPEYVTALTHMPWEFCHVHPIDDPSCAANRRYLEYLEGWAAISKHTGVYEYYGHFFMFTPWPIVHSIRRDIPLFKRLGVERFISETQQNWANQGINFYVAARLVGDPSIDVDALLAEYFTRFYGKAGAPMRKYFDLFESAMQETAAAGDFGYAWMSMFTPALVNDAGALIDQAEALAKNDTEKVQKRVAFARVGFRFTEAFANMLDAAARKDLTGVMRWAEEAQKRLEVTEGWAPQAFFLSLAVQQTRFLAFNMLPSGIPPWVMLRPPKIPR